MTHHRISLLTLIGIGLALALPVVAQEVEQDPNEAARAEVEAQGFRLPPQFRQIEYRDANPWVLHTNVRMGSADSKITFGGIGNISPAVPVPGPGETVDEARFYHDGRVFNDAVRENEAGVEVIDGRYQTYSGFDPEYGDQNVPMLTGDFVAYQEGRTRQWSYANNSQYDAASGTISMNQFSTQATGITYSQDAESTGYGFEMAVSRRLFKFGRRMELGLSGAVGFSDFSGNTQTEFQADLITLTDRYQIFGVPPGAPHDAPQFRVLSHPDFGYIIPGQRETTVLIEQVSNDRTYTTTPGGATVAGIWDLDGAYYSFRFGPELRGHLTEKIAFTAGLGVLGAVVGTDFQITEQLQLGEYALYQPVRFSTNESVTEVMVGYYAEITMEYWLTQRTGFFIGGVIESLDDFVQTVGGRTAAISVGDAYVFRVGIIHRF